LTQSSYVNPARQNSKTAAIEIEIDDAAGKKRNADNNPCHQQ
jgi:hypothetical protein